MIRRLGFCLFFIICLICGGCSLFHQEVNAVSNEIYDDPEPEIDGFVFGDEDIVPPLIRLCNSSHIDIQAVRDLVANGADVNKQYDVFMMKDDLHLKSME